MDSNEIKKLISLIFIGVGLAMGIAVLVLSILKGIDNNTAIKLLSLGAISYGLYLLQNRGINQ